MRAARFMLLYSLTAYAGAPAAAMDSFAIVAEDATKTSRVVSVRIERRLASDDLARISGIITQRNSNPEMRHAVVSFYLPKMPLDLRPWASVDTTPTTKVVIAGLRLEEEHALAAEAAQDRRALVGTWLTDLPAVPGRISIYNDKGKLMLEWAQRSGLKSVDEVTATRGTRGSRFDLKNGGDDYYLLKASGELELRNRDRLIAVAERITKAKSAPIAISGVSAPKAAGLPETGAELVASAATGPPPAGTAQAVPESADTAAAIEAAPRRKRVARQGLAVRKAPSAVAVIDYMRPQISN